MKQIQEIALCRISDNQWAVRARVRGGLRNLFKWSDWKFVVLGFDGAKGLRQQIIGSDEFTALNIYDICMDTGIVPDGRGNYWAVEKSTRVEQEIDDG
jgi:hypothetical protein